MYDLTVERYLLVQSDNVQVHVNVIIGFFGKVSLEGKKTVTSMIAINRLLFEKYWQRSLFIELIEYTVNGITFMTHSM